MALLLTEEKAVNASLSPPKAQSVSFIRKYWSLLLTLVVLGGAFLWTLTWGMALVGYWSLYWMYMHLDAATSLSVFYGFRVLALAIIIGLLLRALLRKNAYFRWRAFVFALIALPIFLFVGIGLSEYDSIQTVASTALDNHTYQWLEFKDFMDPHYSFLECDSAGVTCQVKYTYNLARVCNLSDPRASAVQTLSQNRSTASPTLVVNSTTRTIAAQLNGQTFFTYDIAAQQGIGPC